MKNKVEEIEEYFNSIGDEYDGILTINHKWYETSSRSKDGSVITSLEYPNDYIIKFSMDESINEILKYGSSYIKLQSLGLLKYTDKNSEFKKFSFIKWIESFGNFNLSRVEILLKGGGLHGIIKINLFFEII